MKYFPIYIALTLLVALSTADAWSFPWSKLDVGYTSESTITITADSFRTPRGLVPLNYYRLPMCAPSKEELRKHKAAENIGEILMGNRMVPTQYNVRLLKNETCRVLCSTPFTKKQVLFASDMVKNGYRTYLYLDGLPALSGDADGFARLGHLFGKLDSTGDRFLNNHLDFYIYYMSQDPKDAEDPDDEMEETIFLSRFVIEPRSIQSVDGNCAQTTPLVLPKKRSEAATTQVTFTYSVHWILVDDNAAENTLVTRWDIYNEVLNGNTKVKAQNHWLTVIGGIAFCLALSLAVATLIIRTVRRDLIMYTEEGSLEELKEEKGWKLVRGDVFRAPAFPVLFAGVIGGGTQLLVMLLLTALAAWVGVLKPSRRGTLLSGMIFAFYASNAFSGYVAARLLKLFKKQSWKNGVVAANLVSLCIAGWFLSLNLIHWMKHSTNAIPFVTLFLMVLFFCVFSVPLSVFGVAVGFSQDVLRPPTPPSLIPRMIPDDTAAVSYALLGGIVPFIAGFIEIVLVLGSFWQGEPFYKLGFLFVAGGLVLVISGQVSIVVTYYVLVLEDYRWWWVSFCAAASFGIYVAVYSVIYLILFLELNMLWSIILYFGYTVGISCVSGLLVGTVGFFSTAAFVTYIYRAVKAD